jgi:predicted TPR repeat methyltransferase
LRGDPLGHAEVLIEAGQAGEAASFLTRLIEAGRGGLLARLLLAKSLRLSGDLPDALRVAREAASLNPNIPAAIIGLGEMLLAAGHLPTAIGEFQRALRLDPQSAQARFQLGCAWLEAGEPEKALESFDALEGGAVADAPEKIAEARAMQAAQRSNPRYVRHLFDQFSADYDVRMRGSLSYRAPEILRELASLVLPQQTDLAVLDLGCGTGLAGLAFKDAAGRLDGVDLSPAMIAKARSLGIYDELRVGDIETGLASFARAYDLILAADTIVYLGELAALFSGIAARLAPDGMFLFTAEKKDGEGFELGPKRRWRHSEIYLRQAVAHAGLDICGLMECSPRMEAGVPVDGLAVALTR